MSAAKWAARLAGALVVTISLTTAPPAYAASTTVCTGVVPCLLAGRSDSGYALVSVLSYWNQTPGHNCTNYIAYRLSHSGRLVARPPGTNGASTWGDAAGKAGIPVDDMPSVGSVAWWSVAGVPSSGHVAYVEQVLSDGSILISEDNFTGDFRWRSVSRGAGWPTGFIHYPESNGSPSGVFTSVSADVAGQLDFWGTSSDPDGGILSPTYLVTLGGPRGTPGVEAFTFSTPYFNFHRIKTVSTRGPTTMYLYALNTLLSAGNDVLLGQRPVTIRDASTTKATMVDATITAATTPKIKVTLSAAAAQGVVDITRGTKVLKTVTYASGGQRTYTLSLPKQAKGTHTIVARYRGSTRHMPSSAQVKITVR